MSRRKRDFKLFFSDLRKTFQEHPFELFFAFFTIMVGFPLVVAGASPQSVQALLPEALVRLWGAEILFGGLLTMAGLIWPHSQTERFGCTLLSAGCTVYGLVLLLVVGLQGAVAGSLILGFGLASGVRAYAINKVETVHTEDLPDLNGV